MSSRSTDGLPAASSSTVALAIPALALGGLPRAVIILAAGLQPIVERVEIVAFTDPEDDDFALPDGVARIVVRPRLGRFGRASAHIGRVLAMRRWVRTASVDVLVSFGRTMNTTCRLATAGSRVRLVMTEHTNPSREPSSHLARWGRQVSLSRGTEVVVLTEGMARDLGRRHRAARFTVIPNFLDPDFLARLDAAQIAIDGHRSTTVLGIGRLVASKGFDVVIAAFAASGLAAEGWELRIVGDGPEASALHQLADQLGLSGHCTFVPFTDQPEKEYAAAGVVATASRHEGFPFVVMEALAAGVPVVCTRFEYGSADLIRSEENGLLVPLDDVVAMANALRRVATDTDLAERLGSAAASVRRTLARDTIISQWARLIEGGADRGGTRSRSRALDR